MATSYCFEERWLLPIDRQATYDVLADLEHYPEWWPQIKAVAKLGEDHALVVCRSVLPMNLHLELRPVTRDPQRGRLEVSIDGDLLGFSRFTLTSTGGALDVHYEQEVVTRGWLLEASRWLRPVVRANHSVMMRSAQRGLRARVSAPASG